MDTVVLLLVELIGSVVISLTRCCLPNDEGPAPPPIFFPRTATVWRSHSLFLYHPNIHFSGDKRLLTLQRNFCVDFTRYHGRLQRRPKGWNLS